MLYYIIRRPSHTAFATTQTFMRCSRQHKPSQLLQPARQLHSAVTDSRQSHNAQGADVTFIDSAAASTADIGKEGESIMCCVWRLQACTKQTPLLCGCMHTTSTQTSFTCTKNKQCFTARHQHQGRKAPKLGRAVLNINNKERKEKKGINWPPKVALRR